MAFVSTAQAQDWSGYYLGLHLGYADGDYTLASASGIGPNVGVDGAVGGLTFGRNWQDQNTVYGFEIDISNGPDGITPQGTSGPFWSCVTGDCNASIDAMATLRGRYGWLSKSGLFYVTGGLAVGDVAGGIYNSAQQGGGTATGGVIGLGYETEVGANSTVKVEVLHVDLGDIPFGTGSGTEEFYGDGDFDMLRAGWNWRF